MQTDSYEIQGKGQEKTEMVSQPFLGHQYLNFMT